jgi:hypothetical protein
MLLNSRLCGKIVCLLLSVFCFCVPARAQTASLRGQVTDQNGAIVPAARVTLNGPSGLVKTAIADDGGLYFFIGLPPGDYQVRASASDLVLPEPVKVTLKAGVQTMNLQLKVVLQAQQMTVQESGDSKISTDPAKNAGALVLRGTDLDSLADDPEDLQADLLALAGPSAGPSGGSIFIDGFSGGQLPPKESIREIRVNQNPFSPEYDKLGFGRIEIFTKPGSDKFHGSAFFNFAGDFWNTRNPYALQKAPFLLKEYGGSLSGPAGKRASFFLDVQRHSVDNGSIINGTTLDPATLAVISPFTEVFRTPQRRIIVNPRIDYQLDSRNTLTVRYGFTRADIRDAGIGSFNLVSRGYHNEIISQTAQIAETAVLSASVVNELRLQFFRVSAETTSDSNDPAIVVLGAFNGGSAQTGRSLDVQNNYEFQDYVSVVRGAHSWKFGARLRGFVENSISPQNFGGTFTFAGGIAPVLDDNNHPVVDRSGGTVLVPITSIERYRRTLLFQQMGLPAAQVRALGGGAELFIINAGAPGLSGGQIDVGAFVGDDWRVRPNLTLSLGLRYETQSNIRDWRDFAPRVAFAWAPAVGKQNDRPKTVVRGGFGMFYDRFTLSNTITAQRFNGISQQQYVVSNPNFFPAVPPIAQLQGVQSVQSIQDVSPTLRAPYIMQSALSVERQLPLNTTLAITYANAHGLHLLRSEYINAPLPGTFDPLVLGSGVFPLGKPGPVFQMQSSGLYNQSQLIVNVNARINKDISLFGAYVMNRAMSNTDGIGTFPANPYSLEGEYGPAATDVRHRVTLNGSINLKWNVRISPFIIVDSGPPFDITAGHELYGTTLFNGRPGIPTDPNKPGLILTKYGLLDPNPTPDEKVLPRNFGRGPGTITVNMRLSKAFGFGTARDGSAAATPGPGGGGPDRRGTGGVFSTGGQSPYSTPSAGRRYNVTVSMSIRNLLNHTNPGPVVGNITSPLFGQANQPSGAGAFFSESANNRRLELQMRFTF